MACTPFRWFPSAYKISTIQPYLSYYLSKDYIFILESNHGEAADYSIFCFGVAIPFRTDLIFPEFNYYMAPDGRDGFFSVGVGVRVSLDSPAIRKK